MRRAEVLLAVYASLLTATRGVPSGWAVSGSASLYLELPPLHIVMCTQRRVPELILALTILISSPRLLLMPDVVLSDLSSQFLVCF